MHICEPSNSNNRQHKVFIAGDLTVDLVSTGVEIGGITNVQRPHPIVGGSGYNAAAALHRFADSLFHPIVFGKIGDDEAGAAICDSLDALGVENLVSVDPSKPTCICNIVYHGRSGTERTIYYWSNNANDYDIQELSDALRQASLTDEDLILVPLHMYDQTGRDLDHCSAFFTRLRNTPARIVVDLVPHLIYESLNLSDLLTLVGGPVFLFIGERRTFLNLLTPECRVPDEDPDDEECIAVASALEAHYFSYRFGVGNIERELIFEREGASIHRLLPIIQTGFEQLLPAEKVGFGDRLTADTLHTLLSKQ